MKKKTLVILLIIPFVIALLTFVSVIALTNNVAIDIEGLNILNFREQEGFKINGEYKLEAEIQYSSNQNALMKPGADELVWEVSSDEESFDDSVASVIKKDDGWYLKTGGNEGVCTLSVRNSIGTKDDSITAHIYDKGVILINPVNQSSGSQVDSTRYYGEYDITYDENFNNQKKNLAKIPLNVDVISDIGSTEYTYETSNNITYSELDETISVVSEGEAFLKLKGVGSANFLENTYSFNVVNDGVNVYSFNDLMACTNKSHSGEIVVMQVNLQSKENALKKDANDRYIEEYRYENTKLFGNFNFRAQTFNFNDYLYLEDPKLPTKYMDQFFEQTGRNPGDYQTKVKVGVRIQKDFYGNGFTINMNDLAYPDDGTLDPTTGIFTPDPRKDFFFGPLTYVSIGDLEDMPIIRAFLTDNTGAMVTGDNITVNDIKFQNTNNIENMYNLRYTGTVLEVAGDNVTIKNSVVQNGRTCVRAFSSDNLLIDNCLLQNAGEFILKLGSNKINPTNHNKNVSVNYNGTPVSKTFDEFFNNPDAEDLTGANGILSDLITKSFDTVGLESVSNTLTEIQNGFDNLEGFVDENGDVNNFDAHIKVNNTYFYNSGIYSIGLETSFNGAYLYSGMPSQLMQVFELLTGTGMPVVVPNDIGGTSHPVELTLSGDTRFYDWKNIDDIDVGALIEENITAVINTMPGIVDELPEGIGEMLKNMSIDDYFPIKAMIKDYAIANNLVYTAVEDDEAKYYINRPVAWYGGGYNGSVVKDEITDSEYHDEGAEIKADVTKEVFSKAIGGLNPDDLTGTFQTVINLLSRCVVMATGSHPFKFLTNGTISNNEKPILFDQVPSYTDLSARFAG